MHNFRWILLFSFLFISILMAQREEHVYVTETDSLVLEKLEQWQDLKFGLLMHWGAYSQWGIVESWSLCPEDYGWCERKMGKDPQNYFEYKKEYENLKKTFNPVKFDPDKWAEAAKNAGMRYVIFTTKHHDGFCMFDTKQTDYKVTDPECAFSGNPKANITYEIFKSFRSKGFWTGAYFSKPDWHNENYWYPYFPPLDRNVNYDPELYPARWNKFVQFTHDQIMELMTEYGKLDILWLDGGWVAKKSTESIKNYYSKMGDRTHSGFLKSSNINQDIRMDELVEKARKAQPGLIVVDRAVEGKNQNYLTPENRAPEKELPYPWESCIISGGGWSWTRNAEYIGGREAIHLLIDIIAKGGNLLLNIAPGSDGTWDEGAYNLLSEIGRWMKINSEAVYETRAFPPYKKDNICFTRKKDSKIVYAFYLVSEDEKNLPAEIFIPSFHPTGKSRVFLLGSRASLTFRDDKSGSRIMIPESLRNDPPCKYAWVFKFEIKNK